MLTKAPIPDLDTQFSRTRRFTLILLALVCVGIIFTPGDTFLWGVVVGMLAGLVNAFLLTNRLRKMVLFAPAKAKSFMQQGMGMRFIFIVVVLYVASNIPQVSLYGVGAGLMITPLVSIFDLSICAFKEAMASQAMQVNQKSRTKGGEKI
ncbi:ATP synthase subunit I [Desulfolucanica intricata]|uniref:ATP synthase subunit I n=1 Tax=Desulfolucanica intricata TaxID=1285191 RepID=UPI000833B080|nr:ATP synthase subunit I [Desulfolucanica intricata]